MRAIYNKFYKYFGFLWDIPSRVEITAFEIKGPFCPTCRGDLKHPIEIQEKYSTPETFAKRYTDYTGDMVCNGCSKRFKLKRTINELQESVVIAYSLSKRSEAEVFSLDEPPTQLKTRDENKQFFLSSKIGQDKFGRTMGVIHMGKIKHDQKKEDYAQIFIDFRNEQVRADSGNKFPGELLDKMDVNFKRSKTNIKYKKRR